MQTHMRFDSSNWSRSYTGPKCDSTQTRCRSARALTPPRSSNAPHCQLAEAVCDICRVAKLGRNQNVRILIRSGSSTEKSGSSTTLDVPIRMRVPCSNRCERRPV